VKTLGNIGGRQPETTGDNLKTKVVSPFSPENTELTQAGDTGDNLFESHAHARGEKPVGGNLLRYGWSWQKVVSSVSRRCKRGKMRVLRGDNLEIEVVSGCLPGWEWRAV